MELHLSPIGRNASKEVTDVLFAHLWTVIELDSMRKLCRITGKRIQHARSDSRAVRNVERAHPVASEIGGKCSKEGQ